MPPKKGHAKLNAAAKKTSRVSKRKSRTKSPPEPIAEWDRNVTTQSQRKKATFRISLVSLRDESIDENSVNKVIEKLPKDSPSRTCFGQGVCQPIQGVKRKRDGGIGRKRTGATITEMMPGILPAHQPIAPNSPCRSPIFRLPLEVRERIYDLLLNSPNGILVKPDWQTTERKPQVHVNVLCTCIQINEEATPLLYRNNKFRAIFRSTNRLTVHFDESSMIDGHFVALLRNITLDFSHDCCNSPWLQAATRSVDTLVSKSAIIESLTISVSPKSSGQSLFSSMSHFGSINFADFFDYSSPLITSIRSLAPRELRVVIRKGHNKRFLIALDLKYLEASTRQQLKFANSDTIQLLLEQEEPLEVELKSLRARFEEVCEDEEYAVEEGKCIALSCASASFRVPALQ